MNQEEFLESIQDTLNYFNELITFRNRDDTLSALSSSNAFSECSIEDRLQVLVQLKLDKVKLTGFKGEYISSLDELIGSLLILRTYVEWKADKDSNGKT